MTPRRSPPSRAPLAALTAAAALGAAVCTHHPEVVDPRPPPPPPAASLPPQEPRLVPVESYLRTYLTLFGGLAPLDVQARARGADGPLLFDAWDDYLTALGLPDHRIDLPRGAQTNAVMLAAFERLGAVLCGRSLERDWKSVPPVPVDDRWIYAFEPGPGAPDEERFTSGFDVLHRTFLGYPAALAPQDRLTRYRRLFQDTLADHAAGHAPRSRLTPAEAGWVTVCEGLVRHPEFHLY